MATDHPNQEEAGRGFESIPRGYINAVRVSHTYYDFQLILGNSALDNLGEKPSLLVEPRFVVQM